MASLTELIYDREIEQAINLLTILETIPDEVGYGCSVLNNAILTNSLELVRLCLQKGASVSSDYQYNNDLLSNAICNSSEDIEMCLIDAGVELDEEDENGNFPIHYAAEYGLDEVISVLLNTEDVNLTDGVDDTPLEIAVKHNRLSTATILINNGAALSNSMLCTDSIEMIHLLVDRFGIYIINQQFEDDYPLCRLVRYGANLESVKELLKMGANPNVRDMDGNTPLHLTYNDDNFDNIRVLLEYNIDTTIKNNDELTAVERLEKLKCLSQVAYIKNYNNDIKEPCVN